MKAAVILAIGLSTLLANGQNKPAESAPSSVPNQTNQTAGPQVITIHDEHIAAKPNAIQDGKIVLGSDPPRLIPLDELARITLMASMPLNARWIGQDNHDLAQGGAASGGNGIQDIHIAITGLHPGRKLKQIHVECAHLQRRGIWKLDPSGTSNWRLALQRAESSDTADLYLEPNQDNFDQPFGVTVTYDDGTTAEAGTKAATHTDPQLKISAEASEARDSAPSPILVHLEAGDRLRGDLIALNTDTLKLRTSWMPEIEIPLLHVVAIDFGKSLTAESKQKIEQQWRNPGAEDRAVVLAQDGSLTTVAGTVQGIDAGKLRFTYQGEVRSIGQARLAAIVFSAHPSSRRAMEPYQVFQLGSGDRLSGSWNAIGDESFEVLAAWGNRIALPSKSVTDITFRNGKMIYVSDLDPVAVEEVPYFGRLMPHRRDQNLQGGELKMKGKVYSKGIAVHSRCVLSYGIEGRFQSFKCLVGFDESATRGGRVVCRVLGDGKELFVEPDLRGDMDPSPLELSIAGVRQLLLEVDFGEGEDTCDRVIWADARLFR